MGPPTGVLTQLYTRKLWHSVTLSKGAIDEEPAAEQAACHEKALLHAVVDNQKNKRKNTQRQHKRCTLRS